MSSAPSFHWQDPLLLDAQLTEEERMVRDAAQAYAQDKLATRVLEAFRHEKTDPSIFAEMGELGLLGATIPAEYGGAGMNYVCYGLIAREVERVDSGYRSMMSVQSSLVMVPINEFGSEEQKRQHISAALRGEEVLVQLLSEPSGGSDLAGVITRAERRGDRWIVNGAKTWSTGAFAADYGLLLARTNWDMPKHEGLTMFLVRLDSPGITLRRIKQVNGSTEFCEEFFDDLELSDDDVVGEPPVGVLF